LDAFHVTVTVGVVAPGAGWPAVAATLVGAAGMVLSGVTGPADAGGPAPTPFTAVIVNV
jgi:hypothetical protein